MRKHGTVNGNSTPEEGRGGRRGFRSDDRRRDPEAAACLVSENDTDNRHSPITIVAAMTSQIAGERHPTEVVLHPPEGGLTRPSAVLLNQIRSVDRRRLVGRLGRLKPETMARVDRALRISLGLVKV